MDSYACAFSLDQGKAFRLRAQKLKKDAEEKNLLLSRLYGRLDMKKLKSSSDSISPNRSQESRANTAGREFSPRIAPMRITLP
jgi:hypothetical protein